MFEVMVREYAKKLKVSALQVDSREKAAVKVQRKN